MNISLLRADISISVSSKRRLPPYFFSICKCFMTLLKPYMLSSLALLVPNLVLQPYYTLETCHGPRHRATLLKENPEDPPIGVFPFEFITFNGMLLVRLECMESWLQVCSEIFTPKSGEPVRNSNKNSYRSAGLVTKGHWLYVQTQLLGYESSIRHKIN